MTIIDSHQHYWQLSKSADGFDYEWLKEPQHEPICRDYLPADLKPHLEATGVEENGLCADSAQCRGESLDAEAG